MLPKVSVQQLNRQRSESANLYFLLFFLRKLKLIQIFTKSASSASINISYLFNRKSKLTRIDGVNQTNNVISIVPLFIIIKKFSPHQHQKSEVPSLPLAVVY